MRVGELEEPLVEALVEEAEEAGEAGEAEEVEGGAPPSLCSPGELTGRNGKFSFSKTARTFWNASGPSQMTRTGNPSLCADLPSVQV